MTVLGVSDRDDTLCYTPADEDGCHILAVAELRCSLLIATVQSLRSTW